MKLTRLLATASLCFASFGASADPITQIAPQTSESQVFAFSFDGLSRSFIGGGTLTFHARGDYTASFSGKADPTEVAYGSAEGIDFGVLGFDDATTRTAYGFDDNEWSIAFSLSHEDLVALLADGILNVSMRLDDDVNLFFPDSAYAGVSFDYTPAAEVPEPASLALFGLALAGIGAARRRKQK
ncbi:PEP-CTERM sorting domain-containing protein [Massilia sp. Mn16-1_5]|uniref:PEP-CTERM sorting domain-containing protein n=1 Tax=Massilia sp. Mn16-1_5 TaxID=2079199 RepID=UPI001B34E6FA|nr:PEP-CTERM sorting domain-containing protein [Massilia sp. Mn16-1_5]